jgi:hypothetical protein
MAFAVFDKVTTMAYCPFLQMADNDSPPYVDSILPSTNSYSSYNSVDAGRAGLQPPPHTQPGLATEAFRDQFPLDL